MQLQLPKKTYVHKINTAVKVRKWQQNPAALKIMEKIEDWDFDVFGMANLCGNYMLAVVFCSISERRGLLQHFGLNIDTVCNFWIQVAQEYKKNPYHNHMHGVDVLTNTNYYLKSKIFEGLAELDILACLVSAACHDVGHPGNNNPFEINLESELAVRYNDISVLENMHAAKTWEILKRQGCDFLEGHCLSLHFQKTQE
ncbi:phosphodiesterase [Reticulomyxa filosa]|uniref:Phosphodiesterase n=1 Tax=Reticulomyxa filosa TaxID=46433 RepID=X6MXK7_RETFI|nr:phosphodiesterase [Reticulomyxa filosa]|eukprot:ETO18760.1 phosphodiesterase [Reticulomyxa filosa]